MSLKSVKYGREKAEMYVIVSDRYRSHVRDAYHHEDKRASPCSLQSIMTAAPDSPMTEMNWSMMPQGIPANSCSAFWQASAFSFEVEQFVPVRASRKEYTATSRDAELERPPPENIRERMIWVEMNVQGDTSDMTLSLVDNDFTTSTVCLGSYKCCRTGT